MLKWKTVHAPAGPSHSASYSGTTRVLSVVRSLTPNKYRIKTSLPNFPATTEYESEEEAQKISEELFNIWLNNSNLTFKKE